MKLNTVQKQCNAWVKYDEYKMDALIDESTHRGSQKLQLQQHATHWPTSPSICIKLGP